MPKMYDKDWEQAWEGWNVNQHSDHFGSDPIDNPLATPGEQGHPISSGQHGHTWGFTMVDIQGKSLCIWGDLAVEVERFLESRPAQSFFRVPGVDMNDSERLFVMRQDQKFWVWKHS